MSPEKQASETRSLDQAWARLPARQAAARTLLRRFEAHWTPPAGGRVLDVGAAQGVATVVWQQLGFEAEGVEPWDEAVSTSKALAERAGVGAVVHQGFAEDLPFADESFDLVCADSVMEHVADPDRVFREVYRVLRPTGAFYFHTSSALGFRQREIRGFPLFAWYPAPVKRRIMAWAVEKHPALVGHTQFPAVNWFTPWGVRRDLTAIGFRRIYDRWELVRDDEYTGASRRVLLFARRSAAGRFLGEVAKPGSGFLALK